MGKAIEVLQMEGTRIIRVFPSVSEAARAVGIKDSYGVTQAIHRKTKSSGGYSWTTRDKLKSYLREIAATEPLDSENVKEGDLYKVDDVIYKVGAHGFVYHMMGTEWTKSSMTKKDLLRNVRREAL